MQTMYTKVDGSTLTCLDNLVIELLLNLSNNFLDTCRVDTSVSNKLMKSQTANLTADRIEAEMTIASGVSSTTISTPVAASRALMLRPSRP